MWVRIPPSGPKERNEGNVKKVSINCPVRTTLIIPNVTPCCTAGPHAGVEPDGSIFMDGDCVSDGMQLTCPQHNDHVIFVFGTGWWFNYAWRDQNAKFEAWCKLCQKTIKVEAWSYRG